MNDDVVGRPGLADVVAPSRAAGSELSASAPQLPDELPGALRDRKLNRSDLTGQGESHRDAGPFPMSEEALQRLESGLRAQRQHQRHASSDATVASNRPLLTSESGSLSHSPAVSRVGTAAGLADAWEKPPNPGAPTNGPTFEKLAFSDPGAQVAFQDSPVSRWDGRPLTAALLALALVAGIADVSYSLWGPTSRSPRGGSAGSGLVEATKVPEAPVKSGTDIPPAQAPEQPSSPSATAVESAERPTEPRRSGETVGTSATATAGEQPAGDQTGQPPSDQSKPSGTTSSSLSPTEPEPAVQPERSTAAASNFDSAAPFEAGAEPPLPRPRIGRPLLRRRGTVGRGSQTQHPTPPAPMLAHWR